MQRQLAALAGCSREDQQADDCRCGQAKCCGLGQERGECCWLHSAESMVVEKQSAGLREEPDNAKQEKNIADAGSEKGLLGRGGCAWLLIPEADEQIGGEADNLPAHEEE